MKLRRLPGRRNGVIHTSTLWLASDHLLAVDSMRVNESYRRFYLRDIHALVITRAPRYFVPAPLAALAAALLFACLFPQLRAVAAGLLLVTIGGWWFVAAKMSCICRIYTAVSCETLHAVCRMRTARRMLAQVEPLIAAAQADVTVAPGAEAFQYTLPAAPAAPGESGPRPRRSTLASHLLLFSIFIDAAHTALYLWAAPGLRLEWLAHPILLVQIATAIWVMVQHSRRRLAAAAQRIAIALLLFIGGTMYAQVLVGVLQQVRASKPSDTAQPAPMSRGIAQAYLGGCLVLGATGAVLTLGRSRSAE